MPFVRNTNKHTTLGATISDNEWFMAYILPWNQGCSARLQIPNQPPQQQNAVNAFFTAEMNGCTFIVGGQRDHPITAHMNIGDVSDVTEREQKWASMYRQTVLAQGFRDKALLRKWGVAPGTSQTTAAGKAGHRAGLYQAQGYETTRATQRIQEEMNHEGVKEDPTQASRFTETDLKVSMMGIRDPQSGNWRFFYQRNMYVICSHTKKKLGIFGGLIKFFGQDKRKSHSFERYLKIPGSEYIEFWPTHGLPLRIPPSVLDDDLGLGGLGL